jgi:chemotaxis signal transduction protein
MDRGPTNLEGAARRGTPPPRDGGEAEPPEARAARILVERARALAQPPDRKVEETVAVLAFRAGDDRYAIGLQGVVRVERVARVARVPGADGTVIGLFNLDGRPCALLEVPALLGTGAPRKDPRRWAIVLGRKGPEVALAADGVDLDRIPRARIVRGKGVRAGLTADARAILDAEAILGAGGAPPAGGMEH